jgi:uncharacterized oxidoreductase
MKLSGNTILITGGSAGIGLGMARWFWKAGNRVLICGRQQQRLEATAAAHPGLQTYRCDLSDPEERRRLVEAVRGDGHRVNLLVNNAASMQRYDLDESESLDLEAVRRDIETNLLAPIDLVNLLLPSLREEPGATIVNVSTPGGVVPVAGVPFYCASKAALHSYTQSLRYRLAGKVRVVEVYPPTVETEMAADVKLKKISVEQFTELLMARLEADADEIWIGESRILRLLARLAPSRTFRLVNRTTQFHSG